MESTDLKLEYDKLLKKLNAFQMMLKSQNKIIAENDEKITSLKEQLRCVEFERERRLTWLLENTNNVTSLQGSLLEIEKKMKESI